MTVTRPALVVSESLTASARAVWTHRRAFGPTDPEVHVLNSAGRPLSAAEASPLVPWAGNLGYSGTFYDALSDRRISMVLPLLSPNSGTVQGLLEFLDVPYAGCGMTGVLLAHDPDHSRAVLGSLGLSFSEATEPAGTLVAVLGNEDLVAGAPDDEAAAFGCRVYRGLGLGGWALIEVVCLRGQWCWRNVLVQPDLGPGTPFLRALEARGFDLGAVLSQVLRWGQVRHDAETRLKKSFKDKI